MKKSLLSIVTFFTIYVNAQNGIDLNSVKQDSSFKCKTNFVDSIYFNLKPICDSKNEMEIRLIISGFKAPTVQIIITYKDSTWTANRYKYQRGNLGTQIEVTRFEYDKFYTDLTFNAVFPVLLANEIFSLPDQEELHIKRTISDGGAYNIQYKVKNKFRSYSYINPETYAEDYPEKSELKNISMIVRTIKSLFN